MKLKRDFKFDAAHNLVAYHGKCEHLHGHTYRMTVTLDGQPDSEGMILDFAVLKKTVKEHVLDVLDHAYLNEIIPQPSAENIAAWAFARLDPHLHPDNARLESVEVYETADCSALFSRQDL